MQLIQGLWINSSKLITFYLNISYSIDCVFNLSFEYLLYNTILIKIFKYMINISVIVPTYKPGDYLLECLDSLCNQSLCKKEYEIIIVLNGCCEPYQTKILDWMNCHEDLNCFYYQTNTPGVSNARNIALDVAKGEYITFIDDDDFVSPKYLELLLEKAKEDVIPLCYPLSFVDGTNDYVPYYITTHYKVGVEKCDFVKARRFFAGPVYKLIKKDAIGQRRFNVKFKNGEDSLFMFLISDRFKYVTFTDKEAIYYRRIRRNSATTIHRTRMEIILNELKRDWELTKIFFSNPFKYRLMFYIFNILGSIHSMIEPISDVSK